MIFDFVVRHLHWLSRIPLAPQIFDAFLTAYTALFDRKRLKAMELFEKRALDVPGVTLCNHRFGGIGFEHRNAEIAHLHGNGLLDVEMTRQQADTFVEAGFARPHHVFGRSRWISFRIVSEADIPRAITLFKAALACE